MADEKELFSRDSYWFQHFLGEIKKKDELSKIYDPFKRKQLENFVYSDVRLPLTTGPPTRGKNTGHHKAKEAMSAALVEAKIDPVLFFSSTHRGSCALEVKKALDNKPTNKKNAAKKVKHKLDEDEEAEEEKASGAKVEPPTSDKADAMDSASDAEDEGEAEGDDEEETKEKARGKKKGKDGKGKKRKATAAKSGRQAKKANKAAPGLKKAVLTAEKENKELRRANDRLTKQLKEMLGRQIDEGKAKLEKQMAADKQASKDAASVADGGVLIGPEPAPLSSAPDSHDAGKEKKDEGSADTKPVEKAGKEGPAKGEKPKEQCITCRSWSEDFTRCQSRQHSKEKPAFFCGSPECGGYCSADSCGKAICENCSMQCRGPRLALGVDGVASTGDCVAAEEASGLFCSDDDCINLEKARCYACIRAEEKLEKEEKSDDEGRGSAAGDGNTNDDDEETAKADADDGEVAEEEEAAKNTDKEKKDSDAEEEEY